LDEEANAKADMDADKFANDADEDNDEDDEDGVDDGEKVEAARSKRVSRSAAGVSCRDRSTMR
jgi:hypothetical protein